ncbi:MAG: metallophosphoesterase [Candidatus Poribacteria bacterium]|nr:metallophosphoesterase [Candidatus Poribacteria bacterium]
MMKLNNRSRLLWSILVLGLIVQVVQLTFIGCSHISPYYHPNISDNEKQDIATENPLHYRILLLGDGGQPTQDEPVLKTLQAWAEKAPEKTTIIFLGDNMYPDGMTEEKKHEAPFRLGPQLEVVKSADTHGLFIPGNHDWTNGKEEGYRALLAQEQYINDNLTYEPKFLPKGGSPGPVMLELPKPNPVVRLIVLDTQWWLHQHEKPEKETEAIIEELKNFLDTELPVLVVGHHPLQSYGIHGGFYEWKAHLFPGRVAKEWLWVPVPIVGSLYPLIRWYMVKSDQDMSGSLNRYMVSHLNDALSMSKKSSLLIYASGHEHSLQVLKGDVTDYLLVSGLASSEKATEVSHGDNTLFAHQHTGFMAIDFLTDGRVLLRVIEPAEKEVLLHLWLQR